MVNHQHFHGSSCKMICLQWTLIGFFLFARCMRHISCIYGIQYQLVVWRRLRIRRMILTFAFNLLQMAYCCEQEELEGIKHPIKCAWTAHEHNLDVLGGWCVCVHVCIWFSFHLHEIVFAHEKKKSVRWKWCMDDYDFRCRSTTNTSHNSECGGWIGYE